MLALLQKQSAFIDLQLALALAAGAIGDALDALREAAVHDPANKIGPQR